MARRIERTKDGREEPSERDRILALAFLTPGGGVLSVLEEAKLHLIAAQSAIDEALERGYIELCSPPSLGERKVLIDERLRAELLRWRDTVGKWVESISEMISSVEEWRRELDRRRASARKLREAVVLEIDLARGPLDEDALFRKLLGWEELKGLTREKLAEALREMEEEGLIARLPDGRWTLTEKGREMAEELVWEAETEAELQLEAEEE